MWLLGEPMGSHHATQGTYLHPVRPPLPQTGSQSPAEHQLCCRLPCFLVLRVLEMLVYSRLECYLQYRFPKTYCHLKMELKLSVCVKLASTPQTVVVITNWCCAVNSWCRSSVAAFDAGFPEAWNGNQWHWSNGSARPRRTHRPWKNQRLVEFPKVFSDIHDDAWIKLSNKLKMVTNSLQTWY